MSAKRAVITTIVASSVLGAACASEPALEQAVDPTANADLSPYIRHVLRDEPVAFWRLDGVEDRRASGAVADESSAATRFDKEHRVVLGGMNEFDKYAFTVEVWVRAPSGTFLTYGRNRESNELVLEHEASLVLTVAGESVDTGVALGQAWQLLSVSWDGEDGRAVVALDGRHAWSGELAAGEALAAGGTLVAGGGEATLDEAAWYDRVVHHSEMLERRLVAEGRQAPAAERPHPLRFGVSVGHASNINCVAYSPDGQLVATAAGDGEVKLWEARSGREVRTISADAGWVTSVAFSPTGDTLVSAGRDSGVKLWEVQTGEAIYTLSGHTDSAQAAVFSPDGQLLATGRDTIKLWDAKTGDFVAELGGQDDWIDALAFAPDGRRLVGGRVDGVVEVWDVADRRKISTEKAHEGAVHTVAFDASGRLATSDPIAVQLWAAHGEKPLRKLEGPESPIGAMALSADGRAIATSGDGEQVLETIVEIWEVESAKKITTLEGLQLSGDALAISPDGDTLASGAQYARLWDIAGSQLEHTLGGEAAIGAEWVRFSPDGEQLVVAQGEATKVWQVERGAVQFAIEGGEARIISAAFSPNGEVLATGSLGGQIELWSTRTGRRNGHPLLRAKPRRRISTGVSAMAFGPDSQHLVAVDNSKVELFDARAGEKLRTLSAPEDRLVVSVAYSPDGTLVATGSNDHVIRLWDPATGASRGRLEGHQPVEGGGWIAGVNALSFGPRGDLLASAGEDGTVRIWKVSEGREVRKLEGHEGSVAALAFSRDGRRIASGGGDGRIIVWDAKTGEKLEVLTGHEGAVRSVAFRGEGKMLASGESNGLVKLWHLERDTHLNLVASAREWLIFGGDGVFDASPGGTELAHAVRGRRTFGVDQFALKNNRPDLLLDRMGLGTAELLGHYQSEWERRLAKVGITEDELAEDVDVPEARILRARPVRDATGAAEVIVELRDAVGLESYQIYVDNVPIFEGGGEASKGRRVQVRHEVPLTGGANKVEVSALNTRGQESLRAARTLHYDDPDRGDLYYVGFGVSEYDSKLITDLDYAHRDALDLKALLEKGGAAFGEVHTRTFVDQEVTVASIAKAKTFLAQSKPRDTVVLFVAGHGLYDRSETPTYYYLTHDADPDELAQTAADFASIESLLDGIAARNKLFLLDTCQSGESPQLVVDGSDAEAASCGASRGLRARTTHQTAVKMSGEKSYVAREYLVDRNRFIYRDLRRRTGAIVVSSSMGSESSYEHPKFRNGAFTEAIAEALTTQAADGDGDGAVSTDELRVFVRRRVPELTGGCQHPTVDRDNIHRVFSLPIVE